MDINAHRDLEMDDEPSGINPLIILAPIACCGIPILLLSGALGGMWAWLADGGAATIALAALLAGIVFYVFRRLSRPRADKIERVD